MAWRPADLSHGGHEHGACGCSRPRWCWSEVVGMRPRKSMALRAACFVANSHPRTVGLGRLVVVADGGGPRQPSRSWCRGRRTADGLDDDLQALAALHELVVTSAVTQRLGGCSRLTGRIEGAAGRARPPRPTRDRLPGVPTCSLAQSADDGGNRSRPGERRAASRARQTTTWRRGAPLWVQPRS